MKTDSVTVRIAAPAERVYRLVADVTRMGEWSPECYRCEWVDGATGPSVGARFKAYNKRGIMRWSNTPRVVTATEGREFAFSRTGLGAGEYVWRYRLSPSADGGTDVTESYEEVRPENRVISKLGEWFTPGGGASHLRKGMEQTLHRLKKAAEANS